MTVGQSPSQVAHIDSSSDGAALDKQVQEAASKSFPEQPYTRTAAEKSSEEGETAYEKEKGESIAGSGREPNGVDDDEIELQYVEGARLMLVSIGLCFAIFIVALDNTIIATAIPTITTTFNSLNDVGWYGSAYLLTTTSLQPTFGRIYTSFDVKYTYLVALVIFEVGSVVCAAAKNSAMLIVGRAIAGIGASAIFSGGLNIIAFSVPLEKRAIYIASLSSMFGIASVVGPLLGGAFTDKLTWRWCFWINLPFGAIAIATVLFFFKSPKRKSTPLTLKQKLAQIDALGALFLIGGIVCLLLALQWGGIEHPWNSSKIWGLFIGFGLMTIVFIYIQLKRKGMATIPPHILMQRSVLVSALYTVFFSMAMYIHIFYLPFYFQAIKGTSAVGSGIRTIPYLVSITITSIIVGGIITVTGTYAPFFALGAAVFTVGCGLLMTLGVDSSTGKWLGYQLLTGIGRGAGVQVPFMAVQVALGPKDTPVGTGIVMFCLSLGGAISISVAQNIFSNELTKQVTRFAPEISPQLVASVGATHLREFIPPDMLGSVLEAYAKALQTTFIPPIAFGALTALIGIFIERRNVRDKQHMAGGSA